MLVEAMLDTNVIAYAASGTPADKIKKAIALELIATENFGLSAQVLQEFYVTVTRKMKPPMTHEDALEWLAQFEAFPVVSVDSSLVFHGAKNSKKYQVSYWDGAVLASAERLGASILYSEDLSHGQKYGSVMVVNPFKKAPVQT